MLSIFKDFFVQLKECPMVIQTTTFQMKTSLLFNGKFSFNILSKSKFKWEVIELYNICVLKIILSPW